jgi:CelD/BcsL family acetyltransferase involved in cellulose biosynthesis
LTNRGVPQVAFPFVVRRAYGTRTIEFPDFGISDYNAPILFDPDFCVTAADLWRMLRPALPKHDLVVLRKMPSDVHGVRNPFAMLATQRHPSSGHRMNVGSKWQMQGKSGSKQRDVRRKRRRLAEVGEIRCVVGSTSKHRQELLTVLFDQKRKRLRELGKPDPFRAAGVQEFYLACAELHNICHCAALFIEDVPVALHFGFCAAGRFYWILPSIAGGEWQNLSCGTVLLHHLVELAIAQRFVAFDFGIGDEDYKNNWCDEIVPLFDTAIPSSALGFAHNVSMTAARKLWHAFR